MATCNKKATTADFSHKQPRMVQREVVDRRHDNVYHGHTKTEVTQSIHMPTPPHSYDPKRKDLPDPYFGLKTSNVTDWIQPRQKRFNPKDPAFYFPVTSSDVTTMLRLPIPSHPANQKEIGEWHGRTKTFVTDPGVDDFSGSYEQAVKSRARRDEEGKGGRRASQAPIGRAK